MIAGIGFVRMAWELAQSRTHELRSAGFKYPRDRNATDRFADNPGPSAEFYRITDNAWSIWLDGHQPITRIEL